MSFGKAEINSKRKIEHYKFGKSKHYKEQIKENNVLIVKLDGFNYSYEILFYFNNGNTNIN